MFFSRSLIIFKPERGGVNRWGTYTVIKNFFQNASFKERIWLKHRYWWKKLTFFSTYVISKSYKL